MIVKPIAPVRGKGTDGLMEVYLFAFWADAAACPIGEQVPSAVRIEGGAGGGRGCCCSLIRATGTLGVGSEVGAVGVAATVGGGGGANFFCCCCCCSWFRPPNLRS